MQKHEQKQCPRCQQSFECRVGDITNCQCYGVPLSAAEEAMIAESFPGQCLCRNCLAEMKSRYHVFVEKKFLYGQR